MVWGGSGQDLRVTLAIAMTPSSEERAPSLVADEPQPTAQVLSFERPPSPLQRAVQQRAQEHIEAEKIKPKVSLVRRVATLLIAAIPVFLLFSGFLIAVQAVRFITSLYATDAGSQAPVPQQETPVEPTQPGVIMLVPDRSITVDQAHTSQSPTDQAPVGAEPSVRAPAATSGAASAAPPATDATPKQ